MSWSPGQPTDDTKIRNLGFVIRPNWKAIEEAQPELRYFASNYANRNTLPSAPGENPTAIEDTYITFSKETDAGIPEFFGINEDSVVTQFTDGPSILADNGHTFISGGLRLQWGRKTVKSGDQIDFPTDFGDIPYVVLLTQASNIVNDFKWVRAATPSYTISKFNVVIINSSGQESTNMFAMQWMAIGPA